jgi:hypothetical protein
MAVMAAFGASRLSAGAIACAIASLLFLLSAVLLLVLAFRPSIEVHAHHLRVGKRVVSWAEVRSVDTTGWTSPLIVHMALTGNRRMLVIYPGEADTTILLLRQLQRMARAALIDGVPHHEFWSEAEAPSMPKNMQSPRYPLLSDDDEAEVERLFQRLKAVGHLDSKNADSSGESGEN